MLQVSVSVFACGAAGENPLSVTAYANRRFANVPPRAERSEFGAAGAPIAVASSSVEEPFVPFRVRGSAAPFAEQFGFSCPGGVLSPISFAAERNGVRVRERHRA